MFTATFEKTVVGDTCNSKLQLYTISGYRLGIQKANSDHLLHRGKAKGYFKSFGQQRTLVPTRIIIRNMKKILT